MGKDAFAFEVLELIEDSEQLKNREQFWTLDHIKQGVCYNMPELQHSGNSDAALPVSLLQDEIAMLRQSRSELELARKAYDRARRDLPLMRHSQSRASLDNFSVMFTIVAALHVRASSYRRKDIIPWSAHGLQGNCTLHGLYICTITQDDAAELARRLETLGLIIDRGNRQAGRWVPKTLDEAVRIFIQNWPSLQSGTDNDEEEIGE
jgi:hypothetical protein